MFFKNKQYFLIKFNIIVENELIYIIILVFIDWRHQCHVVNVLRYLWHYSLKFSLKFIQSKYWFLFGFPCLIIININIYSPEYWFLFGFLVPEDKLGLVLGGSRSERTWKLYCWGGNPFHPMHWKIRKPESHVLICNRNIWKNTVYSSIISY